MRVGVQHAGADRPGEEEPHQQLAVVVALLLGALGDDRRQRRRALHPLGDEHGRADRDHLGDDDVGVVGEGVVEGGLRLGLEVVVELVLGAGLQLRDERLDLHAGHQRAHGAGQPGQLAQVGAERLARAGVLHLHRDLAAVVPAALVHLADGRGRRGPAVQPHQLLAPVRPEVPLDGLAHGLGRHRRGGVLQPGELVAVGPGHLVGQRGLEHRQRLAELHRAALELAEGAEQLLGGALLDVAHHRLGRLAAEALAEPERVAAGVPQRQGRQARRTSCCVAREVAHLSIVGYGW